MKQLTVIVNPDFQEDEEPGQFFIIKVRVKDDSNKLGVQREVLKRIRYTIAKEILIESDSKKLTEIILREP